MTPEETENSIIAEMAAIKDDIASHFSPFIAQFVRGCKLDFQKTQ